MTKQFFNPQDEKYKCCFELFHVKTWAAFICAIAVFFCLSVGCNIFYDQEFNDSLFYCYCSAVIFQALILLLALYGIIYSKPALIDFVCCNLQGRIIFIVVIILFVFVADIPASPVKNFCLYLIQQIFGKKDAEGINISVVLNAFLLRRIIQLLLEYYFYIILKRCRQYINDKVAYDKYTQSQANHLLAK